MTTYYIMMGAAAIVVAFAVIKTRKTTMKTGTEYYTEYIDNLDNKDK